MDAGACLDKLDNQAWTLFGSRKNSKPEMFEIAEELNSGIVLHKPLKPSVTNPPKVFRPRLLQLYNNSPKIQRLSMPLESKARL
jgi:hypothetical protein